MRLNSDMCGYLRFFVVRFKRIVLFYSGFRLIEMEFFMIE